MAGRLAASHLCQPPAPPISIIADWLHQPEIYASRVRCIAQLGTCRFCLGDTPLSSSRLQVGFLAAAAIVALRLGIGLHFYLEGTARLSNPKPFTSSFFGTAKGPFASQFKNMIWDADGLYRMDAKASAANWKGYASQATSHFGFDAKQKAAAEKLATTYEGRLKAWLGGNRDEIEEYYLGLKRRDANASQQVRKDLESLRAHDAKIDSERTSLRNKVLPTIDGMWKDLENDINALATPEQYAKSGRLEIGKVGRRPLDSEFMDWFIPYFDTTIGVLLILGLFTRVAATAAGLFLLSVCLSQFPGTPGAVPIYYQGVEMLALFALAAIGAGRFGGLDFFVTGLIRSCCGSKQGVKA